jgi:hypothetical protein
MSALSQPKSLPLTDQQVLLGCELAHLLYEKLNIRREAAGEIVAEALVASMDSQRESSHDRFVREYKTAVEHEESNADFFVESVLLDVWEVGEEAGRYALSRS